MEHSKVIQKYYVYQYLYDAVIIEYNLVRHSFIPGLELLHRGECKNPRRLLRRANPPRRETAALCVDGAGFRPEVQAREEENPLQLLTVSCDRPTG